MPRGTEKDSEVGRRFRDLTEPDRGIPPLFCSLPLHAVTKCCGFSLLNSFSALHPITTRGSVIPLHPSHYSTCLGPRA